MLMEIHWYNWMAIAFCLSIGWELGKLLVAWLPPVIMAAIFGKKPMRH